MNRLSIAVIWVFTLAVLSPFATASSVIFTAVPSTSCYVPVINGIAQGCSALPSYVNGDGTGQVMETVTFNNGTTNGDVQSPLNLTYSGNFIFEPAGSPSEPQFDASGFISVSPGNQLVIDFAHPITYFGMDWASPNLGDTLTINSVSNGVTTFLVQYSFSLANSPDQFVNVNATGISFNEVVLHSGTACCFVTDNHTFITVASAPEPGTSANVGFGAIGMLGLAGWLRRRSRA